MKLAALIAALSVIGLVVLFVFASIVKTEGWRFLIVGVAIAATFTALTVYGAGALR